MLLNLQALKQQGPSRPAQSHGNLTSPPDYLLETLLVLNQLRERLAELAECRRWKHNCVTSPTNVFGNLQESTTGVLLQIEEKNLSVNDHFLGSKRLRRHSFTRIAIDHIEMR